MPPLSCMQSLCLCSLASKVQTPLMTTDHSNNHKSYLKQVCIEAPLMIHQGSHQQCKALSIWFGGPKQGGWQWQVGIRQTVPMLQTCKQNDQGNSNFGWRMNVEDLTFCAHLLVMEEGTNFIIAMDGKYWMAKWLGDGRGKRHHGDSTREANLEATKMGDC